ncbi:MAG: hypothetical protein V4564_23170 [Pseudomonadota bacterium]
MRSAVAGLALFLISAAPAPSSPFKQFVIAAPSVGSVVEVTPGEEFYVETIVEAQPAYRLARPFKSSMAGGMGLPFGFAIDETLLVYKGKSQDQEWSYYIPQNGGFRAYHGLLGNLIHPGDTVGLRIDRGANKEWFVDLSVHYGMPTIWSRPVKEKDPGLTLVEGPAPDLKNAEVKRLVYLGVEQGRMRIRYEWIQHGYVPQRDEFSFPVDPQGRGQGGVKGAEFSVVAGPVKAKFVVTKGISDAVAPPPRSEPESERAVPVV